jgi:peptide/nickel transport system permease protein
MASSHSEQIATQPGPGQVARLRRFARKNGTIVWGGAILGVIVLAAVLAPWIAGHNPLDIDPVNRMKPPSAEWLFGTDALGRDLFSRTIHGGRVSIVIGVMVAACATMSGLIVGLVSGYNRVADAILMRIMDALMSIPAILMAIALMAVAKASTSTIVFAITIVELPRVARLVRGVVLAIREQPYVEAAICAGTPTWKILLRHILPNTVAPLIVQSTFICASAILIESLLSFLGAGTPPEIPSWGNIMAEGRTYFQLAPWIILLPGIFLATTVLAINLMGDGLRDMTDPRLRKGT